MKVNKKHLFLTIFLPIQVLLVQLAAKNPAFIETYYSNGIYPIISSFLRIILGWIPFSFGDILLPLLLFIFLRFLYRLIKSRFKNLTYKIIHFTSILSIIYFCFYLFWGLNYYREPLAKNLKYQQTKYTTEQLQKVTETIIEKLNFYQYEITKNDTIKVENSYHQKEIYKMAVAGYKNLEADFPQLKYKYTSVKSSLMSLLQTYNGTSGYLNPITGFLAANYNDDIYFKYASYRMAFGYCISEIRKRDRDLSKKLWKTINKGITKDFNASYLFWQDYKNLFEPVIKKGYSAYLKANKQAKGVESYNYVVDLLISYFETIKPNSK